MGSPTSCRTCLRRFHAFLDAFSELPRPDSIMSVHSEELEIVWRDARIHRERYVEKLAQAVMAHDVEVHERSPRHK